MGMRPTREDQKMREVLVPLLIALAVGFVLLILVFLWLFRSLLG